MVARPLNDDDDDDDARVQACDELTQGSFKEMREWRKRCDKAKVDFAGAVHKVNAAQANAKFTVADVPRLVELETERERCHRELLHCERMLRRATRRLVCARDAELLDALSLATLALEQRVAATYAQAAAVDRLVADCADLVLGARKRATTLRHRHRSAAARADEIRDVAAIDRVSGAPARRRRPRNCV